MPCRRDLDTFTAFTVGSLAGGAALGVLLGWIGQLLVALTGLTATARLAILAGVVGAGLLVDVGFAGHLPTVRRQVNDAWLHTYRGWVYGLGFGFQLGLGVVTIVTTAAVYTTFAAALLTASPAIGALLGAVFGAARALPVIAARGCARRTSSPPSTHESAGGIVPPPMPAARHRARWRSRRSSSSSSEPSKEGHPPVRIEAHGLAADLPERWDGRVFRYPAPTANRQDHRPGDYQPTLHAASFRLPDIWRAGSFGSGATAVMGRDDCFVALLEYLVDDALRPGEGLFAPLGIPTALSVSDFSAQALQVNRPHQVGLQAFFTEAGRPFCLYVVLGSTVSAVGRLLDVNRLLTTVAVDSRLPFGASS